MIPRTSSTARFLLSPVPMTAQTSTESPPPTRLVRFATPVGILALAAGVLIGTSAYGRWTSGSRIQTTDDAQLRADLTQLSTKSAGVVVRVLIDDFQRVHRGDVLVELDDRDFHAQVALASASVVAAKAALENVRAQRRVQSAKIAQAHANVDATNADLLRTQLERSRQETLQRDRVVTQQLLDVAVSDHERFRATLASRRSELDVQRLQTAVLEAQEEQAMAEVASREANLDLARVNLEYTKIIAPTDGMVGERRVRPGQLVAAGSQVISLVGESVWVVANFKETQLAHLDRGANATVTVDGMPGQAWMGRVETIAPAAGSQFALLPPDNATGNYTKIAQRIPVKIVILPGQASADHLRAGMSVVAAVDTRQP